MERYANASGNSGIIAYEIGENFILVQFQGGAIYKYTYSSTGQQAIENMKNLANQGSGLNSYISRFVKSAYSRRLQ